MKKSKYIDTNELLIENQEESFDLKKWLFRMLRIWPLFLLSLLVCTTLAFLYLRYANPTYDVVASVMVKDEKKGGAAMMDNTVLKEMGLGVSSKLVENETEILKSYDLMDTVVRKLGLYSFVSHIGRIRNVPVFENEVPFSLEILNPDTLKKEKKWIITPSKKSFLFKLSSVEKAQSLDYGQTYRVGNIFFRCMPNLDFTGSDNVSKISDTSSHSYSILLQSVDDVTIDYVKKLAVEPVSKVASVINLEIKDKSEKKAVAILQNLIDIYNKEGLQDKNRVTDNTIDFLNDRLKTVANELQGVEGEVEKFKSQNQITDISSDAQQFLTLSQQVDMQKAQSETQMNIINALERDLLLNQENPKLMPSTLGIQEPSLASLVERHNELVLQKERIVQKSGPENPLLIDLQDQIKEIRGKLLSNVRSLKQAYTISLSDISRKDALLSSRLRNVPLLEKKLVQIKRDQNVQEQLYSFLLQKREESALTLASNIEDSRTIVKARSLNKVSPKPVMIWGIALLVSFAIPLGLISIKDFLNNTVGDQEQVLEKTDIPLIGSVSHIRKIASPLVIGSESRTVAAEQLRNIRTAISFAGRDKEVKTILVTSFQPGDGKSFVSLNLAASYALLNKKIIVLEFDLRKPKISKMLDIEPQKGISSILAGKEDPDSLWIEIEGYDSNLYLLPAGYLPPNPAELILGKNMQCLIKRLKEHFDYIIIDTPPFNLVTDATLLQQYADISVCVLRQSHTSKDVYSELKLYKDKHPEYPLYLLLNDIGKRKQYQNGYGSYRYGSGKGYYHDES